MSGITFDISGIDDAIASIDKERFTEEINTQFKVFGENVVTDAKLLCPVDEGYLRQSISSTYYDLNVIIVASANYAAYIEFGTRGFAEQYIGSLPSNWQDFAAQFKGNSGGGSFDDFVLIIKEWIQRKGFSVGQQNQEYDEESGNTIYHKPKRGKAARSDYEKELDQAAYLIARKIIINGIPAQPFLFPAYEKNLLALKNELKAI